MTEKIIDIHDMPDRHKIRDLPILISSLKRKAHESNKTSCGVIIETVGGRGSDSGYTSGILMQNFGRCEMAVTCLNLSLSRFHPRSWKTYMRLNVKGQKGVKVTPSMKKNKAVEYMKSLYSIKFTQKQVDAFAIAEFGRRVILQKIILKAKHRNDVANSWLYHF